LEGKGVETQVAKYTLTVQEVFQLAERLVLAVNATYATLPQDFNLKIGDTIRIRRANHEDLTTQVTGIEHCDPWTPRQVFAFSIPNTISKTDVPIGSEIEFADIPAGG
jgi:protein involved in polysaccharide export with SLBB domain